MLDFSPRPRAKAVFLAWLEPCSLPGYRNGGSMLGRSRPKRQDDPCFFENELADRHADVEYDRKSAHVEISSWIGDSSSSSGTPCVPLELPAHLRAFLLN